MSLIPDVSHTRLWRGFSKQMYENTRVSFLMFQLTFVVSTTFPPFICHQTRIRSEGVSMQKGMQTLNPMELTLRLPCT